MSLAMRERHWSKTSQAKRGSPETDCTVNECTNIESLTATNNSNVKLI